jgi:hypothetical protein
MWSYTSKAHKWNIPGNSKNRDVQSFKLKVLIYSSMNIFAQDDAEVGYNPTNHGEH